MRWQVECPNNFSIMFQLPGLVEGYQALTLKGETSDSSEKGTVGDNKNRNY